MRKQEFLNQLAAALAGMDREERYRTLSYYDELIDDSMEDGQDEEQAVAGLGDPGQVARELLVEEEPAVPKATGRKVWVIVLLVLGFPLWGSLLLAGACLLLVLFILLYVPVVILGALALSCLVAALMGVVGIPFLIWDVGVLAGGLPAGLFQLGLSAALLGVSALSVVALFYTTKGCVWVCKSIWRWMRRSVSKKGRALA